MKRLHLEEILDFFARPTNGKRGRRPSVQDRIVSAISVMHTLKDKGGLTRASGRTAPDSVALYEKIVLSQFALVFAKHLSGKDAVYRIAEEFGEHLNRTAIKLPVRHVPPELDTTYVEFPDSVCFIDNDTPGGRRIRGAVVKGHTVADKAVVGFLCSFFISAGDGEERGLSSFGLPLPLSVEAGSVEEAFAQLRHTLPKKDWGCPYVNASYFALKCVLYIHSGNPDLEKVVAPDVKTKKRKKLRQLANRCAFDVIRVGYSFFGNRVLHVDRTTVMTHLRWQPYGPGRSQYKLVTIDEHERHFNRKKTEFSVRPQEERA